MHSSRTGVFVGIVLAEIFWGMTFVAFKFANQSFRPVSIVFCRLLLSLIFLFGFALATGRLARIQVKDRKWFLLMALFEPFFYFLGEAFGLTRVSATVGAVIVSTIPLIVPFGAYWFYHEKLTVLNRVGLLVSFLGVLMVILTRNKELASDLKGVILMFVAVLSAVGYTLVVKKLTDHYNPLTITAYQNLYGIILFLPLFLFMEMPGFSLSNASTESLLAILFLGIFGSGICFILMATAIRELGASRANVFGNLIPVVTAITSFLMLKEPMPALKIMGIGVVIGGLLMSQLRQKYMHPTYS